MESIKQRLDHFSRSFFGVCEKEGRNPEEITVVFATKYINRDQLEELLSLDIPFPNWTIGENRVQKAAEKFSGLRIPVPKILIGNLQTNKINKAIELFDEFHAIDSLELAKALDAKGKKLPVFLEVNVSGEESKHGFSPSEIQAVLPAIQQLNNIAIQGLMTMAPFLPEPEAVRPVFRALRELADRYTLKTSMGMSNDWEIAIEEGTDEIRIGSAIFS